MTTFENSKSVQQPKLTTTAELYVDPKTGKVRQAGADGAGAFVVEFKEMAEQNLFAFASGILGYSLLNQSFHLPRLNAIQQVPPYRKLELWPRGHLKTTTCKALLIHILIQPDGANLYFPDGIGDLGHSQGTSTRCLLSSKTSQLAQSTLSEVMQIFENNQLLRGLWPHAVWEDSRRQARVWNAERIELPRKFIGRESTIQTIGVGGGVTGHHFNVLYHDDLIDINDANSPTTMQTAIDWFRASRALADNPANTLEFITGTRWAVHDLYEWVERNDPSVEVTTRRMVEGGAVIFPERYSVEKAPGRASVAELRREHGVMFPLLYMNSAADPELTDFDMSKVRFFKIEGDEIVFDEDERDAVLTEMQSAVAARPQAHWKPPAPRRTLFGQQENAYDILAARQDYFLTGGAKSS